jgi:hypothetical protein
MDISCPQAVTVEFDRAIALLHNFWQKILPAKSEIFLR